MEQISIKQLIDQKYNQIIIIFKDENKEVSLFENKENKERVIIRNLTYQI